MMRRALAFRKSATTSAGILRAEIQVRSTIISGSRDELERTTYSIGTGDALFSEVHAQCMRGKNPNWAR
jgi:hypothetical protein